MSAHTNPLLTFDEAANKVLARLDNDTMDEDLRRWANDELAPVLEDIDRIAERQRGYETFLLEYVDRAGDQDRDEPLCTCKYGWCKLKHGRIPRMVRQADTLHEGIDTFEKRHHGRPNVLLEARSAYKFRKARARYVLNQLVVSLTADRDGAPDVEGFAEQFEERFEENGYESPAELAVSI